jgi:hypothetical protein
MRAHRSPCLLGVLSFIQMLPPKVMDCAQEVEESVCPGKQHLEHLPKAVPA